MSLWVCLGCGLTIDSQQSPLGEGSWPTSILSRGPCGEELRSMRSFDNSHSGALDQTDPLILGKPSDGYSPK